MANSYKKVYIHIVFAVKNRKALLDKTWRTKVFSYVSGVLKNRGHYPLSVGGHKDHIHILFDYSLKELLPELVREIKKASTTYIKENKLSKYQFNWQNGYGIFSVGWKEKEQMINYIVNQDAHHGKHTFREEYMSQLKKFEIEYKDEYVFEFFS